MTKNLPTVTPAEVLEISPEALEIANAYLQVQDADKVADDLDISKDTVLAVLNRREVKSYIDNVFLDLGFNNRFKLRKAMDAIIAKKFQELDEAGIGSSKDILEILQVSHKMTMDYMDKQIQLEKLKSDNVKSQVNVQINDAGSNYGNLIERIINANG
jgi:orotate phosphoribosyltransferase-like protein